MRTNILHEEASFYEYQFRPFKGALRGLHPVHDVNRTSSGIGCRWHKHSISTILILFDEGGNQRVLDFYQGRRKQIALINVTKSPGETAYHRVSRDMVEKESLQFESRFHSDSLLYWVEEMHLDGFRFDLPSILSRDSSGNVMPSPPFLWDIESEPALAGIKLIAEAWDASGLYQVGSFVGDVWNEWNGRFRDDACDFFRGEPGVVGRLADGILGSHNVNAYEQRGPEQTVNFVICHDGFTLNDFVSYHEKHNEANGEQCRGPRSVVMLYTGQDGISELLTSVNANENTPSLEQDLAMM